MSKNSAASGEFVGSLANAFLTVIVGSPPKNKRKKRNAKTEIAVQPEEVSVRDKQIERENFLRQRIGAYRTALWSPEGRAAFEYFELDPNKWTYKQAVYRSNHLHHMGQFDLIPDYDDEERSRHLAFLRELYMSYPELVDENESIVSVAKNGNTLEFDTGRRHFWKVALSKLDEVPNSAA